MSIDITEFTVPAIVACVYIIVAIAKKAELVPDKFVPLFAGVLGVLFSFWLNHGFSFDIFFQGLASGFGATGVNQIYKQLTKEEPKEEIEGK